MKICFASSPHYRKIYSIHNRLLTLVISIKYSAFIRLTLYFNFSRICNFVLLAIHSCNMCDNNLMIFNVSPEKQLSKCISKDICSRKETYTKKNVNRSKDISCKNIDLIWNLKTYLKEIGFLFS